MLAATALLYPCVLAALCIGAGLLADRASGRTLPAALLIPVGAAALIALSQLSTYAYVLAPATPYLMAALALAGYLLSRERAGALARGLRSRLWAPAASVLAYLIALAPVLAAGRPSFSSFMALSDSAVHMIGADYLIAHGQHYAHLDLGNSYGQFIHGYYGTSYPSGADTLFGASARLIGLPLIWAFQPFNAFMLASACGPAWLIARRSGLSSALAALAALSAVLPALVYAYELFGSVKEIAAVPMILTLGALVAGQRDWLRVGPAGAIPFGLVVAAGVSALGVAFGAWALAAAVIVAFVLVRRLAGASERAARRRALTVVAPVGVGALVLLVAAWPTWVNLSGSIQVAQDIAATSNPGNLHAPLRAIQVVGIWLGGSYKLAPHGAALTATHLMIALALLAALLGAASLLRDRRWALAGWFALMLVAWLVVSHSVATWAGAKTLMLTSPAVVLLAWTGVGALRRIPSRAVSIVVSGALALTLAGGTLASDALQYHSSNLAPSARYEELAGLNSRFAGRGPTLFADFDEYSLYELRDLDVGGPDFAYPPAGLLAAASGYGQPIDLERLTPAALLGYPLIITRRDPAAVRPPAAYSLAWQGDYYEVWARRPSAPAALVHLRLAGSQSSQCRAIGRLAASAAPNTRLLAAASPEIIRVSLARAVHPAGWGHQRQALVMKRPGRLTANLDLPSGGRWQVWMKGQFMPRIELELDGRTRASISGELSGNSLVPDTVGPFTVTLGAGHHRLSVVRSGATLAPGDGGSAVLGAVFMTPAGAADAGRPLSAAATADWRSLCGRGYDWVELLRG